MPKLGSLRLFDRQEDPLAARKALASKRLLANLRELYPEVQDRETANAARNKLRDEDLPEPPPEKDIWHAGGRFAQKKGGEIVDMFGTGMYAASLPERGIRMAEAMYPRNPDRKPMGWGDAWTKYGTQAQPSSTELAIGGVVSPVVDSLPQAALGIARAPFEQAKATWNEGPVAGWKAGWNSSVGGIKGGVAQTAQAVAAGVGGLYDPHLGKEITSGEQSSEGRKWADLMGMDEEAGESIDQWASLLVPMGYGMAHAKVKGQHAARKAEASATLERRIEEQKAAQERSKREAEGVVYGEDFVAKPARGVEGVGENSTLAKLQRIADRKARDRAAVEALEAKEQAWAEGKPDRLRFSLDDARPANAGMPDPVELGPKPVPAEPGILPGPDLNAEYVAPPPYVNPWSGVGEPHLARSKVTYDADGRRRIDFEAARPEDAAIAAAAAARGVPGRGREILRQRYAETRPPGEMVGEPSVVEHDPGAAAAARLEQLRAQPEAVGSAEMPAPERAGRPSPEVTSSGQPVKETVRLSDGEKLSVRRAPEAEIAAGVDAIESTDYASLARDVLSPGEGGRSSEAGSIRLSGKISEKAAQSKAELLRRMQQGGKLPQAGTPAAHAVIRKGLEARGAKTFEEAFSILKKDMPDASPEIVYKIAQKAWAATGEAKVRVPKNPPVQGPKTPEAAKLIESIRAATVGREQQAAINSQQHATRAVEFKRMLDAGAPINEARAALAGKFPTVNFTPIKHAMTEADIAALTRTVSEHPSWGTGNQQLVYDRGNALSGLADLLNGKLPAAHELGLLERVFGAEFADAVLSHRSLGTKLWDGAMGGINVPRAMLAGWDLSFPLFQGLPLIPLRPTALPAAARAMWKSLWSELDAQGIKEAIEADPYAIQHKMDAGFFAEHSQSSRLRGEESFYGAKEVLAGLDKIGAGNLARFYRATERANINYLNKYRLDAYKGVAKGYEAAGITRELHPEHYKFLSELVNASSGRGGLPKALQSSAPLLNGMIFSPQIITSHVKMLNPYFYFFKKYPGKDGVGRTMPKEVQLKAMRSMLGILATGSAIMKLAKMAGAEVEDDLRSTDWGKIKIGQTRLDTWGGYQTYARFMTQMVLAEKKLANGATLPQNRADTLGNFARSKASPPVGAVWDLLKGEDMIGDPVRRPSESPSASAVRFAAKLVLPLWTQALKEAMGLGWNEGPTVERPLGAFAAPPAFFGVGVQTYGQKPNPVIRTPAENALFGLTYNRGAKRTPEQREQAVAKKAIETLLRDGNRQQAVRLINEGVEKGSLTWEDADGIMGRAKLDPWDQRLNGIPLAEAEKVYAMGQPDEKERWRPIMERKRLNESTDELKAKDRVWKRERIGGPLTPQEQAELRRNAALLRVQRQARKRAERAQAQAQQYQQRQQEEANP